MHFSAQKDVAILIFANSSKEELAQKNIPKGEQFFDVLTEQTLVTVKKTEFPYFHITEKQQKGNSFGERFANAIQSIFDKGFEQIITIGNDTPHLKPSHIMEAAGQMAKGKSVLGPSADGGFYLMGLHRSRFYASEFKNLPWRTAALFHEVSAILNAEDNELFQLRTLFDLDNLKDLQLFFERFHTIPRGLFEIIRSLLVAAVEKFYYVCPAFDSSLSKTFYNKGSPILVH